MPVCNLLTGEGAATTFCTREFGALAGLRSHQARFHTLAERGTTHCCEWCEFGCFNERRLCEHVRKKHRGRSISTLRHRQRHPVSNEEWRIGSADGLETSQIGHVYTVRVRKSQRRNEFDIVGLFSDECKQAYTVAKGVVHGMVPNFFLQGTKFELFVYPNSVGRRGTSGGLAVAAAFLSLAYHRALPEALAMTGVLAANGAVLGVAGVLPKVIGAVHARKTTIVLPQENEGEIDPVLFGDQFPGITFHYVDTLQQFCALFFPNN